MAQENAFSRNPNLCASCSSLVDGMAEEKAEAAPAEPPAPEPASVQEPRQLPKAA
jgi:hypothetical protein